VRVEGHESLEYLTAASHGLESELRFIQAGQRLSRDVESCLAPRVVQLLCSGAMLVVCSAKLTFRVTLTRDLFFTSDNYTRLAFPSHSPVNHAYATVLFPLCPQFRRDYRNNSDNESLLGNRERYRESVRVISRQRRSNARRAQSR